MFQFKIGTLIYDDEDQEWGVIVGFADEGYYNISWAKSVDQSLNDFDLDQDRFEVYEV
jgi:hypothetical protein